jgi:translation initiation factor IF-2
MNGIIMGFDVPVSSRVEKMIDGNSGIIVRLHKLIYSFEEDLMDIVHDIELAEAKERGDNTVIEVLGEAFVQQIF